MKTLSTILITAAVLLTACGEGTGTLDEVDPEAAPQTPTYTEHVAPIMDLYCTACHAADAQPGELDGYGYDTCDKVRRNWSGLVETAFVYENMPPGGAERVSEAHKLTLQRWWNQGGTCP